MKQNLRLPYRGLLSTAMLLFICSTPFFMAQGQTKPMPSAQLGTAQVGPAFEVVLSELPKISAVELASIREVPEPRHPHFSDAQYRAMKLAASQVSVGSRQQDAAAGLMQPPRDSSADLGSFTPGAQVNVFGQFQGCDGVTWTPSDMGLAVSKAYVVQAVNECISVYNKAGVLLAGPTDLCTFFGRAASLSCFDPRVIYDAQKNKFIVIASFQNSATGEAFIDIAASKTADPRGAWFVHQISRGIALADYPTIGQVAYNNNANNQIITVCDNLFNSTGTAFITAECLLLPKKSVYAAPAFGFARWFNFSLGNLLVDTMQPVNVYGVDENPRAQYIVNTVNYNGTDGFCAGGASKGVIVWGISNATQAQGSKLSGIWTGCNTTGYNFAGAADNAGFCTGCIETIDNRITATVHYASGRIYPSIDANNGGKSAVLGWIIRPFLSDNGAGCTGVVQCATVTGATIEQEWCYACGAGAANQAYFGSQAPTPENDWTMFATFSSDAAHFNLSPGMFYVSDRVSFPTFPHDSGVFSCNINHAYTQFRWGDYSAAYPDVPGKGNIPGTWGSGMFVQNNGLWGTCITENRPHDGP